MKVRLNSWPLRRWPTSWRLNGQISKEQAEAEFWKNLSKEFKPIYSTGINKSLFESSVQGFSMAEPRRLTARQQLNEVHAGITDSYFYIACWKAAFVVHEEDCSLLSASYLITNQT